MKLLRKIDNYLLSDTVKAYEVDNGFKPHSAFLVWIILLIPSVFVIPDVFREGYWAVIGKIVSIVFVLVLLYGVVFDTYLWRVFFRLRREGRKTDRNLFLPESAGPARKYAFYLAFPVYLLSFAVSHFWNPDPQYMLRLEFIMAAMFNVVMRISVVLVIIESVRLSSKNVDSWSGAKHALVVIGASSLLIVLWIYGHVKMHGVSLIW